MKDLLSTNQAAPLAGVKAKTLENWRCLGLGPKFVRVGRLVRYDPEDIRIWREARKASSTSDPLAA